MIAVTERELSQLAAGTTGGQASGPILPRLCIADGKKTGIADQYDTIKN
jgi:hypothetical protein